MMTVKGVRIGAVLLALFLAMIFNGIALWSYCSYVSRETVLKDEKQKLMNLKEEVAFTKKELQEYALEKKAF